MLLIRNACLLNNERQVAYHELVVTDNRFYSLINSSLASNGDTAAGSQFNYVNYYRQKMKHGVISYSPALLVLNAATANWNLRPWVCIGASATDADEIRGLSWNATTETDVLVSEDLAATANQPIIIVSCIADFPDPETDNIQLSVPPVQQTVTAPTNYIWHQYQIKNGYRYESGGPNNRSELNFVITMHNGTTFLTNASLNFAWGDYKGQIAKVHVNDINSNAVMPITANAPTLFGQNLPVAESNNYQLAYITTYEFDWYAAAQQVSWCINNVPGFIYKTHYCRMKYANEWYVNTLCSYNLTGFMSSQNYVAGFGNYKSSYQLKRTN
ncbi:MAG: hypothetical protein ACRC3B_10595 [Bacteroidia bacterium]